MTKKTLILASAAACAMLSMPAAAQEVAAVLPYATAPADMPNAPVEEGRTFRTKDPNTLDLSTVYFDADGHMRIQEERLGEKFDGRWYLRDGYVCTEFKPNGRECWVLDLDAPRGSVQEIASDRGRTIKFTRL